MEGPMWLACASQDNPRSGSGMIIYDKEETYEPSQF